MRTNQKPTPDYEHNTSPCCQAGEGWTALHSVSKCQRCNSISQNICCRLELRSSASPGGWNSFPLPNSKLATQVRSVRGGSRISFRGSRHLLGLTNNTTTNRTSQPILLQTEEKQGATFQPLNKTFEMKNCS